MSIEINKTGLILSGPYKGWHIKVEPLDYGGHLILYTDGPKTPEISMMDGFDHWVLAEKLQAYFESSGLKEIDWNFESKD